MAGHSLAGLAPNVCVINLGCRVNRVESDWMEVAFLDAGCALVPEDDADIVVINTCAVTGEAQAKTRKAVRRAVGLPRRPLVVATGCVANLFPDELRSLGSSVHVLPAKDTLVQRVAELWLQSCREGDGAPAPCPSRRLPAGAGRLKRGVKIQDGCDNRCTYCIVWRARGVPRSVDPALVERQVCAVLDQGAREVELTGINLGRYRFPDSGGDALELGGLLGRLAPLAREAGAVLRASSVEPPEVTPSLVQAMANNADVVCAHMHLPLQSGCSATLQRMGRRYDAAGFERAVDLAREALPALSISTDVIVGFPGETDGEFADSLAFCEGIGFSKIHAFRFSARPDTPAATMDGQVEPEVVHERSERLRMVGERLRRADALSRIGSTERVLVERLLPDGRGWGTSTSFHDVAVEGPLEPGLYSAKLLSVDEDGTVVCGICDG